MPRPTRALVDLSALQHNYRLACERAAPGQSMAVVKADGYGHGIARVAGALAELAPCFAVACIEEALSIRQAGLSQPVVLLEGVHTAEDLGICAGQGFEPVLHNAEQLAWLAQSGARPRIWIKLNTGMNRLGFPPAELPACLAQARHQGVEVRGLMTHFACSDDLDDDFTQVQTRRLQQAAADYPGLALSLANSAAHFRPGQPLFHWTRPGIMLYGATPMLAASAAELGLKPVMTLESELIAVRTLQPGDSVGYGATWVAEQSTPMGIVAIGYGDGYPRHAGTGTPAAVNGRRVRLIGRVSMDMLALDLSAVPDARVGDRVELWGGQVSVDEVAASAGTIGYELLTGVTVRVPRIYRN
ncbi:MAG: alanine racemase [Marinobacter sp.]|uniref:alanine racemase n=1 Tax=Marinobacter sp. TaxID=50741 RepID=UPI00299E12C6|nr:alanine racemase [Marinobacter sp.]MDX1633486.1 alanine racemase [Marinobacter sp.]